MENPIEMDDLGVPLFSETSISLKYASPIEFQSSYLILFARAVIMLVVGSTFLNSYECTNNVKIDAQHLRWI